MVKATLLPPSPSAEISVAAIRGSIAETKNEALERLRATRRRCARYAYGARQRAFSAGYAAGAQAASIDIKAAVQAITATYESALDAAKRDAATLSKIVAARIIKQALANDPEILLHWIDEAVSVLSKSRTLVLSYNSRYSAIMTALKGRIPKPITNVTPAQLGDIDFVLSADHGGIECSWRNALLEDE